MELLTVFIRWLEGTSQVKSIAAVPRVKVSADGHGVVSHAGVGMLREVAGLTGLSWQVATPTTFDYNTTGIASHVILRPSISDDGRVVAYISDVCGLVPEEPQMAGFDGVIIRWMR